MKIATFALGALAGAGFMYLLDPQWGRRRRALLRDQLVRAGHTAEDAADSLGNVGEQLTDRAQGAVHEAKKRFDNAPVDDLTLIARVKSELGRVASHPGSIDATAFQGRVTLHGPVLASEKDRVIAAARGVPGVQSVEDRLQAHEQPAGVPGLQGGPGQQS